MSKQSNLFLFLIIATVLLASPLTSGTAFAENNDDKKQKKTFAEMCAKKKGNEPDALFCRAILGLQQSTNSFFDQFTELRLVDTNLQNQINSFFDIFVELDDVADKQCTPGTFASGTNLDGSLICTDIAQNQDCPAGAYMSGIDDNGMIKCKPLPSGSNFFCGDGTLTAPETCDDGNTANGDGCSAVCSIETPELCSGVDIDDGDECTVDTCNAGVPTHTIDATCTLCGDGIWSATEQCDDGNLNPGDGCSSSCIVETGFSCIGSPSTCAAFCGDGQIVGGEECDSANLNNLNCPALGFSSGVLSCNNSCQFDTSACVAAPFLQTISPDPLNFGNAPSGDLVSGIVSITLDHPVTSDTSVALFLTGSNPTQFVIAGSCVVPTGNQRCDVDIDFEPTSFGPKTATLNASLDGITITSGLTGRSISGPAP